MQNGKVLFSLENEFKRLFTLALTKYQKEIDARIPTQKSQLRVALYQEEKALIQRALRRMNPVNKDFLPTIVVSEQVKMERSRWAK
jgi:hypothetical protein